MTIIYNLLRVKADGTKVPMTDKAGFNIVSVSPYDYNSAVALSLAQSLSGPMESAIWEEIK